MVVVDRVESGEDDLTFVHRGVELEVTIDVGVGEESRRLRDVDDVVEDRDSQRRNESSLLDESVRAVALPIAVGVLQHRDPVAVRPRPISAAIVDPLRDPDPAGMVDVHIGRVEEKGCASPHRHFQGRVDLEHLGRDRSWKLFGLPVVSEEEGTGGNRDECYGEKGASIKHRKVFYLASWLMASRIESAAISRSSL